MSHYVIFFYSYLMRAWKRGRRKRMWRRKSRGVSKKVKGKRKVERREIKERYELSCTNEFYQSFIPLIIMSKVLFNIFMHVINAL